MWSKESTTSRAGSYWGARPSSLHHWVGMASFHRILQEEADPTQPMSNEVFARNEQKIDHDWRKIDTCK